MTQGGESNAPSRPRAHVLLVDDSPSIRALLGEGLRAAGHDVEEACDGAEALRLLDLHGYDVILSDLRMPKIDGFGLIERVRSRGPDSEVIVLTGTHADDIEAAVRATRLGAQDFLTKPLSRPEQVVRAVARVLERRRERAGRRRSDERYRALFERSLAGVYRLSLDGRFLEANEACRGILGYASLDEVLRRSAADSLADASERRALLARLKRERTLANLELKLRRADGDTAWVLASMALVRDEWRSGSETVVGDVVEGTFVEITERKHAEARLSAQLEVTRALAESASLEDALPRVVAAFCEHLGWDVGVLWLPDPDGSRLLCAGFWPVQAENASPLETQTRECAFERGAGLPGRVWASGCPVWIPDVLGDHGLRRGPIAAREGFRRACAFPIALENETIGVVELFGQEALRPQPWLMTTLSDLGTQIGQFVRRRRTEEELRQTEHQLRQAQKMEAVGTLAGGIAHDFNNLLSVIIGYSGLLLKAGNQGPDRERVDQIRKAAERAATLTRQLLAFSRKQILRPEVLNLNNVIAGVEDMVRRLLGESVGLVTAMDEGLGAVFADPGQIEQVVLNLAMNARDAMPRGGTLEIETANVDLGRAYVAAHPGARPGPHVMFAVTDGGCGMDADTLSHVFEPFFTTKEPGKGTGLGLAMVYGIVKQSDGYVEVSSEPGQGSRFAVYLPRTEARAEASPPATASGTGDFQGSETILLVEDDQELRQVVRVILEHSGYTVIEASGPEAALAVPAARATPVHCILSDVVMPGMSGFEVVARLRTAWPGVGALYMSGHSEEAVRAHGTRARGSVLVHKPFTADELLRSLRETLGKATTGREPAASRN